MNKLNKIVGAVAVISTITFAPGCKLDQATGQLKPDVERIAAGAREASEIGTFEVLQARPDWKPHFIVAHTGLKLLYAAPTITLKDVLTVMNQLPVKELKSRNARLGISTARLTISLANWSDNVAERTEQLKPIVAAIIEGMEAGGVPP